MQIKNILVEQKEYVMSEIERFLCIEGISYVKVDNEIHCPNLILRFHEFEEYLDSMVRIRLQQEMENSMNLEKMIEDSFIIIKKEETPLDDMLGLLKNINLERITEKAMRCQEVCDLMESSLSEIEKPKGAYPRVNKRKQLQLENRKYMQRLK